jgi:hypothetical protein
VLLAMTQVSKTTALAVRDDLMGALRVWQAAVMRWAL